MRTATSAPAWRRHSLPLAALACVAAAALHRMAFLGERLYWGDVSLYFVPLFERIHLSLSSGRLPLWNPLVLCGQPILGNPQAPLFYPSMAALAAVHAWTFLTANACLHVLVALVGAYAFAYRLNADRTASVVAATSFGLGGYLISRLQFPSMTMAVAYLPWLLLATDRLVAQPGAGSVAGAAVTVALLILAGHAQVAYISLLLATAYVIAKCLGARGARRRWKIGAAFLSSVGIGALASAGHWLPSVQLFTLSSRGDLSLMQANRFTLEPAQLLNFVAPTYFGHPENGSYWGPGNQWEPCVYVGLLTLALGLWAACHRPTRRAMAFWIVAASVALLLAMGRTGGLYTLARAVLPGLSAFHDPARFTLVSVFALALLAGAGMAMLRERGVCQRCRLAVAALCLADVAWFASGLNPTLNVRAFAYRPRALSLTPDPQEGRVMSMRRETVWARYLSYDDFGPESARYAHELTDTLSPNTGMRFGVAEASGYEPVPVQAVTQIDGLCREAVGRLDRRAAPLLSLLNARLLLLPHGARCALTSIHPADSRGVSAYRVAPVSDRAWIVRSTLRVDGQRRALATLADPAFDPRSVAVVSGSPGLGARPAKANPAKDDGWVVVGPATDISAQFLVHTGANAGFLVWSATAYPGWRATVSGRPVAVERADWALCGVAVPPGTHRVTFRYEPELVRAAAFAGLAGALAIALLVGWTVAGCARKRILPGRART